MIMTTGRVVVGIELHPDLCLTPATFFDQAGEFIERVLDSVMHQGF